MKKIQFLLLIFILFLTPNVFASDYKLNSHISATSGGTKNRYGGLENYNYGSYGTYTFGTRYQGRLGNIETYIEYPFEANTTYTLTYNMNTDDFINHFGSSYWWDCSQAMTNSNATVQSVNYISYKKIKFTFTPTSNTTCIYVSIRSTNPNNTSITQITNWQLDSIYLYDPDYQGGGSGGGSGGTPTPTPNSNQQIIDNANQNTTDIIDNANENNEKVVDALNDNLNSCKANLININNITTNSNASTSVSDKTLNINFTANWGYSQWLINVKPNTTYYFSYNQRPSNTFYSNIQLLNDNTSLGYAFNDYTGTGRSFTTTNNTNKIKISLYSSNIQNVSISDLQITEGTSKQSYIYYDKPQCSNKLDSINDSLTDDNVDNGVGSGFFDDFEDNDYGLSSIITIPLNTIQSLTSQSCVALNVPIPFTNSSVSLPCMTQVYQDNIPTIYNLWKIVSFGLIAYFIAIDIFHMVKGFKDPESDKVEVLDL